MSIVEVALDARANEYIAAALRTGHELSAAVARKLDLTGGTCIVFAEDGIRTDLYAWGVGGKLSAEQGSFPGHETVQRTPTAERCAVEALVTIAGTSDGCFVFENSLASPTDPWLSRCAVRTALAAVGVYHLAFPTEGASALLAALRQARSPTYSLGVWSEAFRGEWQPARVAWSEDDVRQIARQTKALVLGVYDGESYLLWRSPR